jgi:hypothetical protein
LLSEAQVRQDLPVKATFWSALKAVASSGDDIETSDYAGRTRTANYREKEFCRVSCIALSCLISSLSLHLSALTWSLFVCQIDPGYVVPTHVSCAKQAAAFGQLEKIIEIDFRGEVFVYAILRSLPVQTLPFNDKLWRHPTDTFGARVIVPADAIMCVVGRLPVSAHKSIYIVDRTALRPSAPLQ